MSEEYEKAIKLDKKLYKLLKDKDLTLDKLDQQIEKANASYKKSLNKAKNLMCKRRNIIKPAKIYMTPQAIT